MPTRYDDIKQNEVLWITPALCRLPGVSRGFALRVDDVVRRDGGEPCRVWVRGSVLLDSRGGVLRTLTLCVPVDQPRAVLADQAPASDMPPQPGPFEPAYGGVASIGFDARSADERVLIEHAGRLYRRVEVPGP